MHAELYSSSREHTGTHVKGLILDIDFHYISVLMTDKDLEVNHLT